MRFEVLFSHSRVGVCLCVMLWQWRTRKWLQLVDGALLAQLVRNYEHTIKWCSGQMIMSAALPMPTDWLLLHHHDLMIIVMTFSFIIIMNFTIIIIRMTALSFRHSSYCPCTSERQWRRRAGEPQSRGSLSISVCWEIREIVARRVRQIELIFLHLLFFAYPNCLVLRVVSVFVHDQTDNRHRLEVNWLEFIWRHLKTIPRPLVWAKDFKCAPPRCDEEWSRHPKSALSPLMLLSSACASINDCVKVGSIIITLPFYYYDHHQV